MWLQLAFPFYLIFIAISLIIACRYSTTIQRLTARKALPVLATLFLLSYTKILSTVSYALFSYSTITHLPSEHTKVVWAIDANIALSDGRFISLMIICLCILLIQLVLTIVLLFTRLQYLKFITKFKPLLDAFHGSLKDNCLYWAGLQLCIRAVFFSISTIDRNINLAIGLIVLGLILALHGYFKPYKKQINNISELLFVLNLLVIYVFSFYGHGIITINVMIVIAALHFTVIIIHHVTIYGCSSQMTMFEYGSIVKWSLTMYRKFIGTQSTLQSRKDAFFEEALPSRDF